MSSVGRCLLSAYSHSFIFYHMGTVLEKYLELAPLTASGLSGAASTHLGQLRHLSRYNFLSPSRLKVCKEKFVLIPPYRPSMLQKSCHFVIINSGIPSPAQGIGLVNL